MTGSFELTDLKFVTITTGSFTDEGFFRGNWHATLEGITYRGTLEGMSFFSKSDQKIYLKGTTEGEIRGIVEGELAESYRKRSV